MLCCSQAGFNIAIGPLVRLHNRMQRLLARLQSGAEPWLTPALLRADWAERGVWLRPPEEQWCREEPGGHLLTPRPLLHLLNRLRHHPVEQGAWRLKGGCVRHEQDTLPLYRQRSFSMVEHAWAGTEEHVLRECSRVLMALWQQAEGWDLPVELNAVVDPLVGAEPSADYASAGWPAEAYPLSIMLRLPDMPLLSLATAELVIPEVRAAYNLDGLPLASLGAGVERWCLALLVRYGAEPERWPEL
jgi:hypothetical protein